MLITDGSTNYDGSGAPESATGAVVVTYSGTLEGKRTQTPTLTMYSRSDTADFAPTYNRTAFGRFRVNLANTDDYYFTVTGVQPGDSIDLSVVAG
jgi:hypothetical protein